jgi:hypothetical protein
MRDDRITLSCHCQLQNMIIARVPQQRPPQEEDLLANRDAAEVVDNILNV